MAIRRHRQEYCIGRLDSAALVIAKKDFVIERRNEVQTN